MAARPLKEPSLVGLSRHGYYHGIIMKRLVAGFAGAPFGHAFAVLMGKAEEEPGTPAE